ncbi:DUF3558 domain-containing protein [Amycolatopsis sp. NPDC051758]|uniref:DUF3558 domain-containing protein n=1 Tax=Amycolatopsis sp. NPDC051758 TaxID=3363935 RepID=UPI0037BC85C7
MRRAVPMFSALLLAVVACSPTNPGNPSTPSTTTSAGSSTEATSAVPGPGVPKVEHPIDVARFKNAPCDALSEAQVAALLGAEASVKSDLKAPAGPTCDWDSAGLSQAGVGVIFMSADQLGLTSVYEAKGKQYQLFEPQPPVNGFPIVAYGVNDERATRGRCAVAMGVSDTQAVDIHIAQSEVNIGKKDPCAAAHDVAAQVLGNLLGAN